MEIMISKKYPLQLMYLIKDIKRIASNFIVVCFNIFFVTFDTISDCVFFLYPRQKLAQLQKNVHRQVCMICPFLFVHPYPLYRRS